MKALLLAGGLGTRLRPLTENLPKPMAPIANRPWLEHLILHLKEQGIEELVVAARHCADVIRQHFGDGRRFGVHMAYAIEPFPLGTAGAIKNAERWLGDRFLVINADILHLPQVLPLLEFHRRHDGVATIALTEVDDVSQYGVVEQTHTGEIVRFVEKPTPAEAPSNRINAGWYVFDAEVFDFIPAGREVSVERETFPTLIAKGAGVYGYVTGGYWQDMGTPQRYRQAHWDMLDGRLPVARRGKQVQEGVWIGDGVTFAPGALLVPPVLIGDGVVVGEHALIGPYAVIGDNCYISARAHVSRSILWNGSSIREKTRVSNTIFGTHTVAPAGERIADAVVGTTGKAVRA
ncbi:MAG: NDP-sugar synthase [Alicyclobacillus herbarius]|uniref:nucleotidyltransferase family protein n=1 Tax=Alicyclobacillus herbarius TaxID=122960 RepID=UPI00235683AA|nr:NDP-sugar synthase [Alicyclobacillus herbarius]MCL6633033.1 NDP-sugar synthase [Alicyclobacillus herbarius]